MHHESSSHIIIIYIEDTHTKKGKEIGVSLMIKDKSVVKKHTYTYTHTWNKLPSSSHNHTRIDRHSYKIKAWKTLSRESARTHTHINKTAHKAPSSIMVEHKYGTTELIFKPWLLLPSMYNLVCNFLFRCPRRHLEKKRGTDSNLVVTI